MSQTGGQVQPLRKLYHLSGALFALLYLFIPRPTMVLIVVTVLALVLAVEVGRQRWPPLARLFALFVRPAMRRGEEHRPTAGLWSMLAVTVTVLLFARSQAIPAILYAHLGDPAAEVVGRRWGRHRLPNGKSVEGSAACLGVCVAAGLACVPALSLRPSVALVGGLVATVAEAWPMPLGDNLLMAPLAALAMALTARVV